MSRCPYSHPFPSIQNDVLCSWFMCSGLQGCAEVEINADIKDWLANDAYRAIALYIIPLEASSAIQIATVPAIVRLPPRPVGSIHRRRCAVGKSPYAVVGLATLDIVTSRQQPCVKHRYKSVSFCAI